MTSKREHNVGSKKNTKRTCVWEPDHAGETRVWVSGCNDDYSGVHITNCDTPIEDGFKFCPFCGLPITEKKAKQ